MYGMEDLGINIENYKNRNTIMGANFTGAKSDVEAFEPHQIKKVGLNLKLSKESTHALSLIVYAEYDAEIQITKDRQVIKLPNA